VPEARSRRIALHLADLNGGGVQRVMLTLATGFAERGHQVDLLVGNANGPLRSLLSPKVRLVELESDGEWHARRLVLRAAPTGLVRLAPIVLARRVPKGLVQLGAFARELASARPDALVSATPHPNLQAVWARRLSGVPLRLLVTEHIAPSQKARRTFRPWRVPGANCPTPSKPASARSSRSSLATGASLSTSERPIKPASRMRRANAN